VEVQPGLILTAGYILWAIQRVYLGPEYKGPHPEALTPITNRELAIASPLLAFAILFGIYPRVVLDYMQPTVDMQVEQLAAWTEENRPAPSANESETAAVDKELALAGAR
jgi:NADH-quinone oxidoreductase subunit M